MTEITKTEKIVVLERKGSEAEQDELLKSFKTWGGGRLSSIELQGAEMWLARIDGIASAIAIQKFTSDAAAGIMNAIKTDAVMLQASDLEEVALFSTVATMRDDTFQRRRVSMGLRV